METKAPAHNKQTQVDVAETPRSKVTRRTLCTGGLPARDEMCSSLAYRDPPVTRRRAVPASNPESLSILWYDRSHRTEAAQQTLGSVFPPYGPSTRASGRRKTVGDSMLLVGFYFLAHKPQRPRSKSPLCRRTDRSRSVLLRHLRRMPRSLITFVFCRCVNGRPVDATPTAAGPPATPCSLLKQALNLHRVDRPQPEGSRPAFSLRPSLYAALSGGWPM